MRIMAIENVKSGMVVGKTVFGALHQNLLNTGTVLTNKYIKRLVDLGIVSLYIQDEYFEDIDIDDVICDQTRLDAGNFVKDVMDKMRLGKGFEPKECKKIINSLIDELLSSKELLIKLIDIRSVSDYTYFHSVNVAILSGILGISLGYTHLKLQELMVGALFHDIGKTVLYENISCQHSQVEGEPHDDFNQHPGLGFDILKKNKNLSILSAHVAFQHHERYDGKGYPRHLPGSEIHEYAKIVAIANAYDLLTTDCPGKPRIPFHQAVEYLMISAGTVFDPEMVNQFINSIALYPESTVVKLNTGEIAVIVKSYKDFATRPRVRILTDKNGQKISKQPTIELINNLTYFIVKVVDEFDFS